MILAPVSPGDLVDRRTILDVKGTLLTDPAARARAEFEAGMLRELEDRWVNRTPGVADLALELMEINFALWHAENDFRERDASGDAERALAAARCARALNERRAAVKRRINTLVGSPLVEDKQYAGSRP